MATGSSASKKGKRIAVMSATLDLKAGEGPSTYALAVAGRDERVGAAA
jgi:hypothetical protein